MKIIALFSIVAMSVHVYSGKRPDAARRVQRNLSGVPGLFLT